MHPCSWVRVLIQDQENAVLCFLWLFHLEKGFSSDPRSSRDEEGCLTTGLVTSGCDTGCSWPSTLCGDLIIFHLSCVHVWLGEKAWLRIEQWSWRDGTVVKSSYCSYRKLGFSSPYPHVVAHDPLEHWFQEIWHFLLVFSGSYTHAVHIKSQTYTIKLGEF